MVGVVENALQAQSSTLGKIIKKVFLFLEPPKIGRMMGEEKVKPF